MKKIKILMVGDSHGTVILPYLKKSLVSEGYISENIDVVANNGWATYSYLDKQSDLDTFLAHNDSYDFVIVELGGNNGITNDGYGDKVFQFLDLIRYPKSKVIWIGPFFASHSSTQARHLFTHQFLEDNLPEDVLYIPMMEKQGEYTLSSDGIHYKMGEYRRMVDNEFLPVVKEYFKKSKKSIFPMIFLIGIVGYFFTRR